MDILDKKSTKHLKKFYSLEKVAKTDILVTNNLELSQFLLDNGLLGKLDLYQIERHLFDRTQVLTKFNSVRISQKGKLIVEIYRKNRLKIIGSIVAYCLTTAIAIGGLILSIFALKN